MTPLHLKWNITILYWILSFLPGNISYNLDTKFPILYAGSLDDYFGFSVGLLRNNDGYKALITAPKANSSEMLKLHQPGVLFSCDISFSGDSQLCEEVVVDSRGNDIHINHLNDLYTYRDKQDDMWLGVSLDIQRGNKDNNVVVCGHLWKDQHTRNQYFTNGVCYVISNDLDTKKVQKLVPFVHGDKQVIGDRKAYYGFALAGTSSAFSEDGQSLLLGSPGFYEWSGTVAGYERDSRKDKLQFNGPTLPTGILGQMPSFNDYLGYSITTGKFFSGDTTYSAVGAPRGENKKGVVYIFKPLETHSAKLEVYQKLEGVQFGGYFGASVSGIDINGDRLTDLLVGSPLYSDASGGDEGRVYIYISRGKELEYVAELAGRNKRDARFGTCIADVGDLNIDGFSDVAIGAPYEDEKGAVYIYHGSKNGLNEKYAQRIGAAEVNPMISGFGISVSRGLDIDDNSYLDLLIGSYASSNALLFRTHPIIQVSAEIEFDPPKINRNITACDYGGQKLSCFNVSYCLKYTGQHAPSPLEFKTELLMDYNYAGSPRGFMLSSGLETSSISGKARVYAGADGIVCFREIAYINKNIKDEANPIQFFLNYELDFAANPDHKNSSFCKDCPIIDFSSSTNTPKSIPFEVDCGPDNICFADLVVEAYVLGNREGKTLIIGQYNALTLDVTISNRGEPAYASMLTIYIPSEISLVKQDFCDVENDGRNQDDDFTILKCDFGNSLKHDKSVNLQIKIDVKRIMITTKLLNIRFNATTVSNEINETDNILELPMHFEAMSDIGIFGYQEDEQIPYTEEKKTASVSHKYYVINYGPSPVEKIDISLYIPTAIYGANGWTDFLNFTDVDTRSDELSSIPAKCDSSSLEVKNVLMRRRRFVSDENDEDVATVFPYYEVNSYNNVRGVGKRSTGERSGKREEDHVLDCESAKCVTIHCVAGPFRAAQSAKISVSAHLNLEVLISAMETWNSIEFITKGKISMDGQKMIPDKYPDETAVKTAIVRPGSPIAKEVAKWIILVSILIGIALLLIILAVLIKIGFFKRQKRETMRNMMYKADLKESDPNLIHEEEEPGEDKHLNDAHANNNRT